MRPIGRETARTGAERSEHGLAGAAIVSGDSRFALAAGGKRQIEDRAAGASFAPGPAPLDSVLFLDGTRSCGSAPATRECQSGSSSKRPATSVAFDSRPQPHKEQP